MDTITGITKNISNDNIHFLLEENEQKRNNNETDGLEHDEDSESEIDIDSLMEEFDKVEFTNNAINHPNFDFLGSEYYQQDQSIAIINNYNVGLAGNSGDYVSLSQNAIILKNLTEQQKIIIERNSKNLYNEQFSKNILLDKLEKIFKNQLEN